METRKRTRKRNILKVGAVPMLSVKRISEHYGFHPHTVRAWCKRDRLRHRRHGPGGKIFIRQDDVEEFVKEWYQTEE